MIESQQKEKKVEYLELVYDLIFVYIIGRNNSLLQQTENGFVSGSVFLAYVLCTLAVIQIWNFSTFYINIYGRNGARDYIFLFLNMFLLYFMADGTNIQWQPTFYKYNAAWALILVNIGMQHLIETKNHRTAPEETKRLKQKAAIILTEAALIGAHIAVYAITGVTLAYVPILFGILAMMIAGKRNALVTVDFAHLSERAMLYVVFTFGEMIIALASYFKGELTPGSVYFSAMAFLIVAGLLLSYGVFYNRLLDRERETNGTAFMLIHIFLIFALNNLSASLEFMREEEVALLPKTLFLVGSFVLYYVFLFLLGRYAKKRCAFNLRFVLALSGAMAAFAALMLILRRSMYLNIALSVVFVFGVFAVLFGFSKKHMSNDRPVLRS